MLKHSDKHDFTPPGSWPRLRLCVNQHGDRMDNPATVHDVNILTVVASESYKDFVGNLQQEISDALSARLEKPTKPTSLERSLPRKPERWKLPQSMAIQIYKYLLKNDYTDDLDPDLEGTTRPKSNGALAQLPPELALHAEQIFGFDRQRFQ